MQSLGTGHCRQEKPGHLALENASVQGRRAGWARTLAGTLRITLEPLPRATSHLIFFCLGPAGTHYGNTHESDFSTPKSTHYCKKHFLMCGVGPESYQKIKTRTISRTV